MKRILPFLCFLFFSGVIAQTQDALNKFRLAQSFEQASEYDRAARLYEDLLSSDSTNYPYFDGLRRCYEQLKNYDAEIALCSRRLVAQPSDLNIMAILAAAYYKSGSEGRADSVWNAIIARGPSNAVSYRIVASSQAENRLFDKSIATYLLGRKALGDRTLFVGELSVFYALTMNYAEATREYITMLLMNEHQLDFIESRLSTFTVRDEGLNAAITATENALSDQPKSVVLRRLLVWLYMEGKRFEKAYDVVRQLEDAVNSNGIEVLQFADRAYKEKSYDVAASAYRYAIEHYPRNPQIPVARFGYARVIEELGSANDTVSFSTQTESARPLEAQPGPRGAMALYLALAQEYPRSEISIQSLYRIGVIRYERFFDLDGALQILDSLLTLVNARQLVPGILETAGKINIAQGKLDKASERYSAILSSIIATPGQKTQAQFRLAEIQYFQYNFDSAASMLHALTQTLSSDEANDALLLLHFIKENQAGFPEALREYAHAELLRTERKYSEAIAALSSTIKKYPDALLVDDAFIVKAELSLLIGQFQDALGSYQKLLSDYPKSILRDRAQFGVAELYQFQFKQKEKAIQAYEELLSSFPHSLYVDEARKRIRLLRGDVL